MSTKSWLPPVSKKLPRRSADERSLRTLKAQRADRRALNLEPDTFTTSFGGLFLFAFDLARINLSQGLQGDAGIRTNPYRLCDTVLVGPEAVGDWSTLAGHG